MNAIHVKLFDKAGWPLDELEGDLQGVLWRLGETGTLEVGFGYGAEKVTRSNLRSGNRVLARFSNGLPDWGGVIDYPTRRRSTGVAITAYEGDHLLSWRITAQTVSVSSTAPGAIVQALMDAANAEYPTGIYVGDVYDGGSQSREYHYSSILDSVRDLRTESGYDYAVVPLYMDGQLTFDLHWYERRGLDQRDEIALVQGKNVGDVEMDEQGPVYSQVIVVGKGDTWPERPKSIVIDSSSKNSYGLRQTPRLYLDIGHQGTLDAIAQALSDELAHPAVRATLIGVTNEEPGPYSEYGVGDVVTLRCFQNAGEWSFDEPVRILSRQWLPDGTCTLEIEQWRD